MGKIVRVLAIMILITQAALVPARGAAPSITQEEAEKFVNSFYNDLAGDDLDRVMIHFDETVDYYNFGKKQRDYIANELGQYFNLYPSRTFSISGFKLKPAAAADRVTANFDLHAFLRNPDRDVTSSGHAHVEWDLVKRNGVVKIVRFAGTAADTSPSPKPAK